jgi:F-type H+-transporting ATPase subunit delta
MNNHRKVHEYGKALFTIASQKKNASEVHSELVEIIDTIKSVSEFKQLLYTKRIKVADKILISSKIFDQSKSSLGFSLLSVLLENDEVKLLEDIVRYYKQLLDKESNLIKVIVYSANELDASNLITIQSQIETKINKKVELSTSIDSSLLGGLKLRIGNTIIDGSVSYRLNKIKESLIRA